MIQSRVRPWPGIAPGAVETTRTTETRLTAGISPPHWKLVVTHPSGSLEAAVSSQRRRNLAISSSVLGLLGASMGLLVLATRRAQRLAKQQMEFVAAVSHELRTPLAVIRSAAENLADGVVHDEARIRRYGELMRTEGRRLTEMVEQILEFAGIQSGQRGFALRPVGVGPLLHDIVSASSGLIEGAGLAVDFDIPADLPPVLGDEPALRRVFQNLIDNAIKYGAAGGSIRVSGRKSGSEVSVTVADRGIGIDRADQTRIFEPFYRAADVVAAQMQGAGLGLSLVQRIVAAHGGRVTVKSAPREGSEFTVHLPAAHERSRPSPRPSATRTIVPPPTPRRRRGPQTLVKRLLLVEDEPGLVMTLTDRLTREGYAVEASTDGESGLERASAAAFDLVLLDVMLPRLGGFDVVRELRKRGIETPVIMLTARGQVVDKVVGLKLGADDYVTKPFEMVELLARIEAKLRRAPEAPHPAEGHQFGDIRMDFRKAEITKAGEPLELSAREFQLLRYFIEHRGATLSREELLNEVWGYNSMPSTRTVDVHVAWLRQKIEPNPRHPQYILTDSRDGLQVRGITPEVLDGTLALLESRRETLRQPLPLLLLALPRDADQGFADLPADDRAAAVAARLGWEPPGTADALADRWRTELARHGVSRVRAHREHSRRRGVGRRCRGQASGATSSASSCSIRSPPMRAQRLAQALGEQKLRGVALFPAMHRYRLDDEAVGGGVRGGRRAWCGGVRALRRAVGGRQEEARAAVALRSAARRSAGGRRRRARGTRPCRSSFRTSAPASFAKR